MSGGTRVLTFVDQGGDSFVLADGLAQDDFEQAPFARVQAFWAPEILRNAFLEQGSDTTELRQFFAEMAGQPLDTVGFWLEDREIVERILIELEIGGVGRLTLYRRVPHGRVWGDAHLPHPAPPPPPPPPPPPTHGTSATVTCEVVSISAHCEHGMGRKVEQGKTLEVVPSSTAGYDNISLKQTVEHAHGKDPTWTISEGAVEHYGFRAIANTVNGRWIPRASPHAYNLTCQTCSGSSMSLAVHAYPNNLLKIELDLDKIMKIVEKLTHWLKKLLNIVTEKVELEFGHFTGSVEAQWKEHTDWRAFYAYKIQAEGELVKASVNLLLGPSKIVNLAGKIPGIGKYIKRVIEWLVKAGVYFKLTGKWTVSLKFERTKPEQPTWVRNLGGGSEIAFEVSVGILASVWHDDVIKVDLSATGGVSGSGEIGLNDKGIEIKPKTEFSGLKGAVAILLLSGWIKINETVVFVDPQKLWEGEGWEIEL